LADIAEETNLATNEASRLKLSRDYAWYSLFLKESLPTKRADTVVKVTCEYALEQVVATCITEEVPVTIRGTVTINHGQCTPFKVGVLIDINRLNVIIKSGAVRSKIMPMFVSRHSKIPSAWKAGNFAATHRLGYAPHSVAISEAIPAASDPLHWDGYKKLAPSRSPMCSWSKIHLGNSASKRTKHEKCTRRMAPTASLHQSPYASPPKEKRALRLADGAGRNSVHLAKLRFAVETVDISIVELRKAQALARKSKTVHNPLRLSAF
jgi:hypothetical protein